MKKTQDISYMILAGCCALLVLDLIKTPEGLAMLKEALDYEKSDTDK